MKQKTSSVSSYKNYLYIKGLNFLILLFFIGNVFAQKTFKKSITTSSSNIIIALSVIDQIEIIVDDDSNEVVVIAKSEDNQSLNFILEDKNGMVFIKDVENYLKNNNEKIDKVCSIQPIYTSYQIKIPIGKNIDISFSQGNFYSNYFDGKLNLKLDEGIVKLNRFDGTVNIKINGGNVFCSQIKNANIDVNSNLGLIYSNLVVKNFSQNDNRFEYNHKENKNELFVNAISANIHLKALEE